MDFKLTLITGCTKAIGLGLGLTLLGPTSAAWSAETEIRTRLMDVPSGYTDVFAAFPNTVLLKRRESGGSVNPLVLLVNLKTGKTTKLRSKGAIRSMHAKVDSSTGASLVTLTNFSLNEWRLIEPVRNLSLTQIRPSIIESGLKDPKLMYLPQSKNARSTVSKRNLNTPDSFEFLVWDNSSNASHYLLGNRDEFFNKNNPPNVSTVKWIETYSKTGYDSLYSILKGDLLLNIFSEDGRAEVLNTTQGYTEDSIGIPELQVANPDRLRSFAPHAMYGGTEKLLLINNETDDLIILTINPQKRRPLSEFVVPLKTLGLVNKRGKDRIVIADQNVSRILLGTVGSDSVAIFQNVKGGLVPIDRVTLPFALGHMTVVPREFPDAESTFVFLSANGTQMYQSPIGRFGEDKSDIKIFDTTNNVRPQIKPNLINTKPNNVQSYDNNIQISEVVRVNNNKEVQSALVSLGYNIGVIDGILGTRSIAALRSFQIDNKLPVTGTATLDTKKQLLAKLQSKNIGQFHAVISSYPAVKRACRHAIEDVAEFAKLLAGSALTGLDIYVARTRKSNNYAVTIDVSNQTLGRKVVALIKKVSPRSTDKKTGSDAFIQRNAEWYIDANCSEHKTIQ